MNNVLALTMEYMPSFDLGIKEPLLRLQDSGYINFRYMRNREVSTKDIDWCDILVCCRYSHYYELEIVEYAFSRRKYIAYFLDDDLINIPPLIKNNGIFRQQKTQKIMRKIMSCSDCLWSSSQIIINRYEYIFSQNAHIQAISLLLDETNEITRCNKEKITIGFSGGIGHAEYIDYLLSDVLVEIEEKYQDKVHFEFFGAKPLLINKLHDVKYIPLTKDYDSYKNIMKGLSWDIGLAPLTSNYFTACKYHNKFLEYGSRYMAGIYSDVPPFNLVVKNGVNGILCENNPESWKKALIELIENEDLRYNIAYNANEYLRENNTEKEIEKQLLSQIPFTYKFQKNNLMTDKGKKKRKYRVTNNKILKYVYKIIYEFENYHIHVALCNIFRKFIDKIYRMINGKQ